MNVNRNSLVMISVLYLLAALICGIRNEIMISAMCLGFAMALLLVRMVISFGEAAKAYKEDPQASGLSDMFNQAI